MLKFKNEYEKGAKRLEITIKKHVTTRNYKVYCNLIYKIKCNYKNMFGEDLEKIEKEKIRLKLEIECIKNPIMGYVITIISVVLAFLLKSVNDIFLQISKDVAFMASCVYVIISIGSIAHVIVNIDHKLRGFIFSLQALEELEEEIRKEIDFNLALKKIEYYK